MPPKRSYPRGASSTAKESAASTRRSWWLERPNLENGTGTILVTAEETTPELRGHHRVAFRAPLCFPRHSAISLSISQIDIGDLCLEPRLRHAGRFLQKLEQCPADEP